MRIGSVQFVGLLVLIAFGTAAGGVFLDSRPLLWCAIVVGTVDNFLRPRLVGRDTKMSDLLVLLGTLGGLIMFGAIGFIVGPIIAALFITVWEIYGHAFADYLPAPVLPQRHSEIIVEAVVEESLSLRPQPEQSPPPNG